MSAIHSSRVLTIMIRRRVDLLDIRNILPWTGVMRSLWNSRGSTWTVVIYMVFGLRRIDGRRDVLNSLGESIRLEIDLLVLRKPRRLPLFSAMIWVIRR